MNQVMLNSGSGFATTAVELVSHLRDHLTDLSERIRRRGRDERGLERQIICPDRTFHTSVWFYLMYIRVIHSFLATS